MKNFIVLLIFAILMMASCSEQQLFDEYASEVVAPQAEQETTQADVVKSYIEKARWGDGTAYLKLAECYHDGIGAKPDFMSTLTMLMMADQYGIGNRDVGNYIRSMSDTDHTKMMFEAIAKMDKKNTLPTDSIVEALISTGSSDGYALKGIILIERGDTLGGHQSIKTGADLGSSFAKLLLCTVPSTGKYKFKHPDMDMLKGLSDQSPIANKLLGDIYSGYYYGETSNIDESLAALYYKKADEQGCLGKLPARWLINYYDRNDIKVDSLELRRLQILSGHIDEPGEFIPDSVCVDEDYFEADTVAVSD